jgi:hypothetical protein
MRIKFNQKLCTAEEAEKLVDSLERIDPFGQRNIYTSLRIF